MTVFPFEKKKKVHMDKFIAKKSRKNEKNCCRIALIWKSLGNNKYLYIHKKFVCFYHVKFKFSLFARHQLNQIMESKTNSLMNKQLLEQNVEKSIGFVLCCATQEKKKMCDRQS